MNLSDTPYREKRWTIVAGIVLSIILIHIIAYSINPLLIWLVLLLTLLGFYIAAHVLFKKGRLAITRGKFDKVLVILSAIALFAGSLCSIEKSANNLITVFNIIGIILLCISLYYTIINNKHDPVMMLVAIIAKMASVYLLVIILFFAVVLIIIYLIPSDKNKGEFKALNWIEHLNSILIYG